MPSDATMAMLRSPLNVIKIAAKWAATGASALVAYVMSDEDEAEKPKEEEKQESCKAKVNKVSRKWKK